MRDALAGIELLRDANARQLLIDELTDELGRDFDPPRTNVLNLDCAAIVRSCVRLGALHELLEAVQVVVGSSAETATLNELVERLAPAAVLNSVERRRTADLLASTPLASLERLFAEASLSEYWDREIQNVGDAIERLAFSASKDPYTDVALLKFLERVAHQADPFSRNQCHQIIQNAAVRLGREEDIRRLCQQLSGEVVDNRSYAPSTTMSPMDRTIQVSAVLTSGDEDVTAIAPPATPPRIIGGIPPQNPSFTGRQGMLRELRSALRMHSHATLLPHTLHGLGGVGKTQLATEYAHRFQQDYDIIWWIPSDRDSSIMRSLLSLARRLKTPESDDNDDTVRTVLDDLSVGRPSRNWLLIYDNAGDPSDVRRHLPSGTGQVLITSRNRDWSNESSILEVDVFSEDESIEFLTRRWEGISEEEAHLLAEELGRLPLALDQAVAVHRVTGMPLEEYLRLLKKSPGLVLDEGESSEYPQSVAKTCSLAFDGLRKRSPGAAQLLEVCSFLSSSDIAVPLLVRGRGAPLPSPLNDTLLDNIRLRAAIREIGRYGLAQLDAGRDFIKVHMLVGKLLRDALPPDRRDTMERAAHALLAFANPQEPDDERTWPLHRQVTPHVLPSGIIHSSDTHSLQVILDQIRFFFVSGDYRQSAALARLAVDEWKKSLGPDHLLTLRASFHLGNALRALGDYQQAGRLNKETLDLMRRELGDSHEDTLRASNSYAADLRLVGQFKEALAIDEELLRRYRALDEDDNEAATLRSVNNLAVDYRLLGDFSRAYEIDSENLERRRAVLGENSPEVLSSAGSVARDLYGIGDYGRSLEEAARTIQVYRDQFKDHLFYLIVLRHYAITLRKVGRHAEAIKLSAEILDQSQSHLGPKHEHSLSAMMTLANALRVSGTEEQLTQADEAARNALKLYQEGFGVNHPFTLACATNQGIIWRALNRVEEALSLDRATVESLEGVLGDEHPYTLCALTALSNDLSMTGNHAEARVVSQDVYNRSKHARSEDHPYTLACATNLAVDLEATGATAEAMALRLDTRRRLQFRLGLEHPDTVNMERGRRAECDNEVPPT